MCGLPGCCGPAPQLLWLRKYMPGNLYNKVSVQSWISPHVNTMKIMNSCFLGVTFVFVNCCFCALLEMPLCCFQEDEGKKGRTQVIYRREGVCMRERPHFKAFLLFPKRGWKSAAWLSPNKWLLLPFQSTQRPNPRTTWATNVDSDWDHHSMCQTLLTTHKTHWLQLYEVKMAQKRKMWRRCPQSFLPKNGHSIWAFNGKIKPEDRVE